LSHMPLAEDADEIREHLQDLERTLKPH